MPKINTLRLISAAFLLTILASSMAFGQFGNTYYHMFGVPQANHLNPAFQPSCNGYFAIPGLGPLRFETSVSPITFGDVMQWDAENKKYNTFLHPDADSKAFLDILNPVNPVQVELATSLIAFGWRSEALFFTVDFSEHIVESTSMPGDLFRLALNGTLDQQSFDFSGLGQNIMHYHQFAIGASYNLDDEMFFGIRAKLLLGGANVSLNSSRFDLTTSINEWGVNTEIDANISVPFLELPVDDDGLLDLDTLDGGFDPMSGIPEEVSEWLTPSTLKSLGGLNNPGFAIDIGFNYVLADKLGISASAVDLGFIRWKNNPYVFKQTMDYTFTGLPVDGLILGTSEMEEVTDELMDTILSGTEIKVSNEPYTTMLSGKVYLGLAYDLTERVRFGGVFRTRIHDYKFYNQFTFSANVQPIRMFSASVSYSIYENSYMNLGLGLALKLGPLNVYFITDQAPSAYLLPEDFSTLNFRLGMNFVWGCRKLPKAMKDRPLID